MVTNPIPEGWRYASICPTHDHLEVGTLAECIADADVACYDLLAPCELVPLAEIDRLRAIESELAAVKAALRAVDSSTTEPISPWASRAVDLQSLLAACGVELCGRRTRVITNGTRFACQHIAGHDGDHFAGPFAWSDDECVDGGQS